MEIIKNRLKHYGEAVIDTDTIDEGLVIIVPDTNPDALQIIGTRGTVYIQEKSCIQGMFKATGSVNCCISYISTEGKEPYTVNASIPFAFSKEVGGMEEDDRMTSSLKLLSLSSSLVNPRKLSLKAQVQITEKLYKCQTVEYAQDILSGSDDNIQCLKETVKMQTITDIAEKRIVLSDEIRLGDEKLDGRSVILKSSSDWVNEDVKVLPNKIMVRGRVDIWAASISGEGEYIGKSKYSVPFSQIIECDGVQPEDSVEVSYSPAREEIEIFTSSEDITTMTFAFAAVTECIVKREVEIETIKDIYSTRWEMEKKTARLSSALAETKTVTVPVKETISLDGPADKVMEIGITGSNMAVKKGESTVGGNFYISIICQMSDGSVITCSKKAYVDGICPAPFGHDGWCVSGCEHPTCEINGDGEAIVSFDALFTCCESSGEAAELVSSCTIDKSKAKESRIKASLIIKQADKNHSVWEIAKAYNTSPAVIASANKLGDNEDIQAGRLILIPFVNR